MRRSPLHLLLPILAILHGCAARPDADVRDAPAAELLYQQALTRMAEDPAEAERLLRQALERDPFHGGACNNLGVLLLREDRLPAAAEALERARKLLPDSPEPRINLALVFDRAGRTDDAMEAACAATEVRPGHLPAIQLLALLCRREGRSRPDLARMLDEIALRGDADWRAWAQEQRQRLPAPP